MHSLPDSPVDAKTLFNAVMDAAGDAIVVTNAAGTIVDWNPAAARLYGYTREDAVGRPLSMLFPPNSTPEAATIETLQDVVQVARSGTHLSVTLRCVPIAGPEGRAAGTVYLVRDTRAQRAAEQALEGSEARARAIIDTAVDAIILIDRSGLIEAFNPAAERLFGHGAQAVIGRNVSMLMPEPFASEHDAYIQRYRTTGERRIIGIGREVTGLRQDGTTFPAHLSVAELKVDGETKFTGIIRDLTERVALEARLREESGLVRLGELAAVLAHEVKNPLAAVSGAMQVLSTRLPDPDDREIVGEVLRRLDGLSAMMSDLLLFARPPKPRRVLLQVADLIENLLSLMRHDPAWQQVHLRFSGDAPTVLADAELLKVALQNLLVNAAQAMDLQGHIEVSLSRDDRHVHIDVTDTGPGIAAHVQPKLFTPFFTTKARGTGLGLATVARIAEAHGGSIRIASSDATGTCMRLTLPAHMRAPADVD